MPNPTAPIYDVTGTQRPWWYLTDRYPGVRIQQDTDHILTFQVISIHELDGTGELSLAVDMNRHPINAFAVLHNRAVGLNADPTPYEMFNRWGGWINDIAPAEDGRVNTFRISPTSGPYLVWIASTEAGSDALAGIKPPAGAPSLFVLYRLQKTQNLTTQTPITTVETAPQVSTLLLAAFVTLALLAMLLLTLRKGRRS